MKWKLQYYNMGYIHRHGSDSATWDCRTTPSDCSHLEQVKVLGVCVGSYSSEYAE